MDVRAAFQGLLRVLLYKENVSYVLDSEYEHVRISRGPLSHFFMKDTYGVLTELTSRAVFAAWDGVRAISKGP